LSSFNLFKKIKGGESKVVRASLDSNRKLHTIKQYILY